MKIFFLILIGFSFSAAAAVISGTDLVLGKPMSVDSAAQKIATVLVFLSANCPCSKSHEPALAELAQNFSDMKFIGLHANSDESNELAKEHFSKAALPFPIVRDENQKWAKHFKAYKTPHVFVIDNHGEELYGGGVDNSKGPNATEHFLADALRTIQSALAQGKRPPVRHERVMGCEIL